MSEQLFYTVETPDDHTPGEHAADEGGPSTSGPRSRRGSWVLYALLFCTAFLLTARMLRPQYPEDWQLRSKMKHFEEQGDQYDMVFFGSSRFLRAIAPDVFEEELGRRGHSLTAFNFGVGPMRPHEMNQLIRRMLVDGDHRPRWAVIEVMDWNPTFLPAMRKHERTVRWHSTGETLSALRTLRQADLPTAEKLDLSLVHLQNWIAHLTNYGRGPVWVAQLRDREQDDRSALRWIAAGQGYRALDDEPGPRAAQRRDSFLKNYAERFLTDVEAIPGENARPGTLKHINVAAYRRQQAMLERAGIVPIYVIPPLRWGTPDLNLLISRAHLHHAFRYNAPQTFPELYDRDLYWDRGHFNKRGAAIFSRLFAVDFARWLSNNPAGS